MLNKLIKFIKIKKNIPKQVLSENNIQIPKKLPKKIILAVQSKNNTILLKNCSITKNLTIKIYGDNNTIEIGNACMISYNVNLFNTNAHPARIVKRVWNGMQMV